MNQIFPIALLNRAIMAIRISVDGVERSLNLRLDKFKLWLICTKKQLNEAATVITRTRCNVAIISDPKEKEFGYNIDRLHYSNDQGQHDISAIDEFEIDLCVATLPYDHIRLISARPHVPGYEEYVKTGAVSPEMRKIQCESLQWRQGLLIEEPYLRQERVIVFTTVDEPTDYMDKAFSDVYTIARYVDLSTISGIFVENAFKIGGVGTVVTGKYYHKPGEKKFEVGGIVILPNGNKYRTEDANDGPPLKEPNVELWLVKCPLAEVKAGDILTIG